MIFLLTIGRKYFISGWYEYTRFPKVHHLQVLCHSGQSRRGHPHVELSHGTGSHFSRALEICVSSTICTFTVQLLRSGQLQRLQFIRKVGAEQQSGAKCLLRPRWRHPELQTKGPLVPRQTFRVKLLLQQGEPQNCQFFKIALFLKTNFLLLSTRRPQNLKQFFDQE